MTFKKVMSALLAGAMVLTMGMTAMANDETSKSDLEQLAIEVGSTVNVPTLKIMIPNSVGLVVNPYKLQANVGTNENPIMKNGQIVSKTYFIKNYSPMGIKVTPTISGGASFTLLASGSPSTSPDSEGYLEKQGIVNFEYAVTADATEPVWGTPTNKLVLGEEEAKPSPAAIPMLSIGTEPTSEAPNPINFDNSLAFRFTGDVTGSPTEPWTTDDSVNASLVFDFASQPNENDALLFDTGKTDTVNIATTATSTTVMAIPTSAPTNKGKIAWKSSDTTKATIVADGGTTPDGKATVTGVATGDVTITATYLGSDNKVHIGSVDVHVIKEHAIGENSHTGGGIAITDAAGQAITQAAAGTVITVTGTPTGGNTKMSLKIEDTESTPNDITTSCSVSGGDALTQTFTMPDKAVKITATFSS